MPPAAGSASVVTVEPARGEPIAVTNTNNATIANDAAGRDAATATTGWEVKQDGWGVESAPRHEVLARIAASPVRVLVQAGASFEECSGLGGTHVFFTVPDSWGQKPFAAATLGGHGIPLQGVFPPGHLYVAGVRLSQHAAPSKDAGWCLGEMGASDAAVIAVLPVRNADEGLRVLGRMR